MSPLRALVWLVLLLGWHAPVAADEAPWLPLFDGRSLTGWRAAEHPASFRVADGVVYADGPRAHLFYTGEAAPFENFELSVEVRTAEGANSGLFFHTAWQESGWPSAGFEVQINNTQPRHGGYLELKKTGSLYGIRNVYPQLVRDETWFTLLIRVQRPTVEVLLNGTPVVHYVEPEASTVPASLSLNRLGRGTFALQCHDPLSRVAFRNLRVRRLPDGETAMPRPRLDAAEVQRLTLARANFPLIDSHTHLKGDLTLARALQISRRTGMNLGVATNGGIGFPIQNDAAALAFLQTMAGQPVFVALQAEGREWMRLFSAETRARFDYVFSDAMTYADPAGRRLRLWIPEEAPVGDDVDAFMDHLVATTVRVLTDEPIDVYANPTYLPEVLASQAESLWTEARMQRVIAAAVAADVAIEINARYRLPSERFLRLAKAAGVKFTFGTNNTSAEDFGAWDYPLEMQRKLNLEWEDMWVPGHAPSRAQRELSAGRR